MTHKSSIDNKTAAETILMAAIDAAMSVPHKNSEHACIALCGVRRKVSEFLLVPGADEVHACRQISVYCTRLGNRTAELSAQKVYNSADSAALEFVQLMLSEQVSSQN